jgi:hypothetical protein
LVTFVTKTLGSIGFPNTPFQSKFN